MPNFVHTGKMGDVIMSLPLIKHMGGGKLYLVDGPEMVDYSLVDLVRFLNLQPYIQTIFGSPPPGELVEDLSVFRQSNHLMFQHIIKTYFTEFAQVFTPINTPFLVMPEKSHVFLNFLGGKKFNLINVTQRYTNMNWGQYIGKQKEVLGNDIKWIFTGNLREYSRFCIQYKIYDIVHYESGDVYSLAYLVNKAEAVYCNQSLVYTLALLSGKKMFLELNQFTCAVDSANVEVINTKIYKGDKRCQIVVP